MIVAAVVEHVELQDVGHDLARELALAREQRAELAADAVAGDAVDGAQLDVIEAQIAALERELERSELAAEVLARREREAVLAAAEGERHRRVDENVRLTAERDALIGETVLAARHTAELAARAIELDNRIWANTVALGGNHHSVASLVGDRIAVELLDAGVQGAIGPILSSWRNTLLRAWPMPEEGKRVVASCSICSAVRRDEIEEALAAGTDTLRGLEERFGVSRSALSRHKAHASVPAEL